MKDLYRKETLENASNKKRKQHFVPKFYLKFFSDVDNKFYAYDLEKRSLLPDRVFYESQCHKKYFYGEDGVLENLLSQKEGEWATVCRKIIARHDLDKHDFSLLKQFVLYQRQRTSDTNRHSKETRESFLKECVRLFYLNNGWVFDEEAELFCKKRAEEEASPAEDVAMAMEMQDFIEDLAVLIVRYDCAKSLIVSDSPVITLNPFMRFQGFGYDNIGIVFLMPISPKDLLIVYDDYLYKKYKNLTYLESKNEDDVLNINRYELVSAERMAFSADADSLDVINDEVFSYREKEESRNKTQFLGPEGSQRLVMTRPKGTDCYYDIPFINLPRECRRIPYSCREAIPRHYAEGWDKKLAMKYEIFTMVNRLPIKRDYSEDIQLKTELKLGCRRMENLAKEYWKSRGYNV